MRFNFKFLLLLFFILLFSTKLSFSAKAPDFQLQDINGKTVRLADFKGKVVFIDFWATWCPPCRESIPAIKKLHKDFSVNPNIVILGLNLGEKKSVVEKFVEKNEMNYSIVYCDDKTANDYAVRGIPLFVIVDKNGNIAQRYTGYVGGLEKEWNKVINELSK
jgi:thiol-disulfide isomerase/thioredoxin